jgi:hypothetical protein
MSASKTEHYQLHQWGDGEQPNVLEMNQNFTALDAAVAQAQEAAGELPYVVGTYVGTGGYMTLSLGFRPRMVLVTGGRYTDGDSFWKYTAVITEDSPKFQAELTDDGFMVRNPTSYLPWPSESGRTYTYIAFR